MPITWRNVNGTVSNSGSASLLRGAQQSFDGGFGALQKVLEQRQATQDENWEQGSENNTNALMNKLAGVQDPTELAAMRERGEFQKMMGQYGAQVDQDAVRKAIDGRGQYLRNETTQQQEFGDTQTNRDLRPQVQAAMAKLYNGDESGMTDLQNMGIADDGEMLTTGFGALDKASRLDIAEDGNARGWAQNARAEQDQSFKNYERARIKDANELSDRADGLLREAYQGAQDLPDGTDMTAYKRATQDALVDAGVDPTRASELANNLDGSVTARENASAMDTKLYTQATSKIDRVYEIASNEFNQDPPADPQQAANDILRKFENEDGELPGGSDPEERRQFAEEAGELMRRGVEVDGIVYPVTPALLEAAMSGTGDVFWDDRPVDAMHDFIKNSPAVQERFKKFQAWKGDTAAMQDSFNQAAGSGYESELGQSFDAMIKQREQEFKEGAMTRSSEKARNGRSAGDVNDLIQFR